MACSAARGFRTFLTAPGIVSPLLAGVLTGFLPCGLLYAMLALAAATRDLWMGGALMATFALGTAPAMVLAGAGGSLLGLAGRRRLLAIAAWCVIITGGVSIARGCGYLTLPGVEKHPGCPMCEARADAEVDVGRNKPCAVPAAADDGEPYVRRNTRDAAPIVHEPN
jgi:sulfite exporter TauE/SafE